MRDRELPTILYKYRSWSIEKYRRILTHNSMFFAFPKSFNDPFDCTLNIRYDNLSSIEITTEYSKSLLKIYQSNSPEDNNIIAAQLHKDNPELYNRIIKDTRRKNIETINSKTGILSMSNKFDDLLMWSHYANSHQGICIGFDYEKLSKYMISYFHQHSLQIAFSRVFYKTKYPYIKPIPLDDKDVAKILTIKAKIWKHEGEWRYILWGDTNIEVICPDEIFYEVYLGCRVSEAHRNEIIDVLKRKQRPIKLYEASPNSNEFKLDFNEVNY